MLFVVSCGFDYVLDDVVLYSFDPCPSGIFSLSAFLLLPLLQHSVIVLRHLGR